MANLLGMVNQESNVAGDIGKLRASQITGESFYDYVLQSTKGQGLKQWAGAEAFLKQAQTLGINPIIAGETNNMLATTMKGVTMSSPAEAEKIGQMQAYMLRGELEGLGGNPSQAEFVSATDMAKKLAYALGVGGPAGAAIVGGGQGKFDLAKWEEIGKKAGTLGRYEAEGLISKYDVDHILAHARNMNMVQSMEYEAINSRMNNLLPTLKSAIMGKGKLTQADAGLIDKILQAPKDDQVLQSVKQQLLQHAAKYEADMYARDTKSNLSAMAGGKISEEGEVGTPGWVKVMTGGKLDVKQTSWAGAEYKTSSDTSTHDEYRKVLGALEHTNLSSMNASEFVREVNELGKKVQGNPVKNVYHGIEKGVQGLGKKLNEEYPGPSNINNAPSELKKFDESHPPEGPIVAPPTGGSTPSYNPPISSFSKTTNEPETTTREKEVIRGGIDSPTNQSGGNPHQTIIHNHYNSYKTEPPKPLKPAKTKETPQENFAPTSKPIENKRELETPDMDGKPTYNVK